MQLNENYESIIIDQHNTNPGSNTAKQDTNSQQGTDHANDKNNGSARSQSNKLLNWNKRTYRKRYIQIKSICWPSRIKTNGGKWAGCLG